MLMLPLGLGCTKCASLHISCTLHVCMGRISYIRDHLYDADAESAPVQNQALDRRVQRLLRSVPV